MGTQFLLNSWDQTSISILLSSKSATTLYTMLHKLDIFVLFCCIIITCNAQCQPGWDTPGGGVQCAAGIHNAAAAKHTSNLPANVRNARAVSLARNYPPS